MKRRTRQRLWRKRVTRKMRTDGLLMETWERKRGPSTQRTLQVKVIKILRQEELSAEIDGSMDRLRDR
jgi:hypothetical protein